MRFRLPVSGLEVEVRPPSGTEDVLLADATACDWPLTLRLIALIAQPLGRDSFDWGELVVTDADALLLLTRRGLVAEGVSGEIACRNPECAEQVEVAFGAGDYLEHHEPVRPHGVVELEDEGWFGFDDEHSDAAFRLPRCRDLVELAAAKDPERELVRRCVRPSGVSARVLRRVVRAMESLAPLLAHDLDAACPQCGWTLSAHFDPQWFSVIELRRRALSVYADVHLIASVYHWSEAEILALPRERRRAYAEIAQSAA
jgi:hypothetical protein